MSSVEAHDSKERVRQAVDIVDLVGSYLELRRQGRIYVALCPWHEDSRPSLQVNPDRQSWKCWVCDIGGDIFNFVMQKEGIGFRDALVMLAERAGIEIAPASSPGQKRGTEKSTLYEVMAWAEKQFHDCLRDSPEAETARKYLSQRGITTPSVERYRIGFSPNSWQWLVDRASSTSYSSLLLESVGLIGKSERSGRYYDRFKGRVLFPIRDAQARPIAMGGRILPEYADDRAAKYINSPETRLFSKSEQLYGLDVARDAIAKSRHVIVMEGYTDVVVSRQHGLMNCVAVLGTALGGRHLPLLRRFADKITLVLDGDEAGQRRTNEILELFVANQVDLRVVTLPSGLDPCDFVATEGLNQFQSLVDSAVDALEHRVHLFTDGLDVNNTHQAHLALEQILSTLAKTPRLQDNSAVSSMRLREQQLLVRLARQFQLPESELRSRVSALRRQPKHAFASHSRNSPVTESDREPIRLQSYENELFEILTVYPDSLSRILENIQPAALPSREAQYLLETYRGLDESGRGVHFNTVLTAVESPEVKNLLVRLDEQSHQKKVDPETRLHDFLIAYQRLQHDRQSFALEQKLQQKTHDDQEELQDLQDLIAIKRQRQGISAPTDG